MDCGRSRARPVDPVRETIRGLRGASSTIHCRKGARVREFAPADSETVEQGLNFQPSILAPRSIRRGILLVWRCHCPAVNPFRQNRSGARLLRRVEEINRTRSGTTIHAQSTARETNHATGTRRVVRGKARAPRNISQWATHNCLVRNLFWGVDFKKSRGRFRPEHMRDRTSAARRAWFSPSRHGSSNAISAVRATSMAVRRSSNLSRHLCKKRRWTSPIGVAVAICARSTAVVRY